MINTKDVLDHMQLLASRATTLRAGSIPGGNNILPATATAAPSVAEALSAIAATDPEARVLICGSLYLAGTILRENG